MFGDTGGRIVGAVICIGLIPSISAMMWLGPRVTMTMGEDFPLLSAFARKTRNGVPAVAILFQLAVVSLLLLTQSFQSIVQFIQFSLTISSFLAVLGVIVLRHTQPALPRPYKVWGYPATPLLFLAVSLFMMINLLIERPVQALTGAGIMLSGLVIYAISRQRRAGLDGESVMTAIRSYKRAGMLVLVLFCVAAASGAWASSRSRRRTMWPGSSPAWSPTRIPRSRR